MQLWKRNESNKVLGLVPLNLVRILLILFGLSPLGEATADVITTYDVAAHTVTAGVTSMPVTSHHPGLTASAITFGAGNESAGITSTVYEGGSFCAKDWSNSDTPVADEYFELSMTPQADNTIDFSSVEFGMAREDYYGGGPTTVRLSYSIDGTSFITLQERSISTGDLVQAQYSVDISALTNISGQIRFRWYGYNALGISDELCFANAPESTTSFSGTGQNLIFNGTVSALNNYPTASSLSISGDQTVGQTIIANYIYQDDEVDPESGTTFQWYRADDAGGTNKVAIAGAIDQTYAVTVDDGHKYLTFTVTPAASSGSTPGSTYESAASSRINKIVPYATNVFINGSAMIGGTMAGNYTFNDDQGHNEASSIYQWYRADDMSGTNRTAVTGATNTSYTVLPTDEGKNFSFAVTVVADTEPTNGDPAETGFTPAVVQPAIAHYSVGEHLVTEGKNELTVEYVIPGPGVTASALTLGTGLIGVPTGNDFYDGGSFCATNFTTASSPDPNDYFQLVLTPEAGNQITYQNVLFALAREYFPDYIGPASVQIQYSTNGTDFSTLETLVIPAIDFEQTQFSVDLSSLGKVTSPVWFRWYGYATSGVNSQYTELCFTNADAATTNFSGTGADLRFNGTVGLISCGNGDLDSGEVCDDSNTTSGDGCSADCLSNETCGNGYIDVAAGENCDDNNTSAGDGCGPTCLTEICGNGYLDPGEVCDDSNTTSGDGCSADCLSNETCGNGYVDIVVDELCDDANTTAGDGCGPTCLTEICGNGYLDPGEVCDDSNTTSGDGCSADCLSNETCGNGYVDLVAGELCDDANTTAGDGCGPTCLTEICGNGYLDPGEVCDDSNTTSGDGCSADCLSNETCGNGYIDVVAGELCDDANTTAGDGCGPTCLTEICGNGYLDPGEVCDDTNTTSGDGCSADCLSNETCGNGYIDVATGEVCDDTNTISGDGCSADCLSNEPNVPVVTASQTFSVDENAANTSWVGTVLATDDDAGTIFSSWVISTGNTDAIFAINPSTGEITVDNNTNLDFETMNSYPLGITVSDGIHTSKAENVTVNINNMNDLPYFSGTPTINGIPKIGKTLSLADTGTIDADGDTVTLSYQWAADGVNIPNAILDTYQLTKNETLKKVNCFITADDGNGGSTTYITAEVNVLNGFPWLIVMPSLISPNKVSEGSR